MKPLVFVLFLFSFAITEAQIPSGYWKNIFSSVFSRWRLMEARDSDMNITETSMLGRYTRQMLITSYDKNLADLNMSRSTTFIDFKEDIVAVHVILKWSGKVNPEFESDPADPQDKLFLRRVPACFLAYSRCTLESAITEMDDRSTDQDVMMGTPRYYTTDWNNPLREKDVERLSSKIAAFCLGATKMNKTYGLRINTSRQGNSVAVSGQVDASQRGKSVPWKIEIQNGPILIPN